MATYNKFNIVLLVSLLMVLSFIPLRKSAGSMLLTLENSSEGRVAEISSLKGNVITDETNAYFDGRYITLDDRMKEFLAENNMLDEIFAERVLGYDDSKWIEVSLSQQRLYAWENGRQVYSYLVSTGKWAPTPKGEYRVWTKLKSTTMKGGSKALGTYYYLPNVPCTMYFYKGYGIHGAYWHNNFGQPMSHGCVNMRPSESCELFNWASVGTKVVIRK